MLLKRLNYITADHNACLNFSGERETSTEVQSNGSAKDCGSGSVTRVREESGPCVALLVCLVNK